MLRAALCLLVWAEPRTWFGWRVGRTWSVGRVSRGMASVWSSIMACPMLGLVRTVLGRTKGRLGRGNTYQAGWFDYVCLLRPDLSGGSALLCLAGVRGWRVVDPRLVLTFGRTPRILEKISFIMSSRPSHAGSPEQCAAYLCAASYLAAGHYSRVFRREPSDKMELRVGAPPGLAVCCLGCVRILCSWAPLYIR